MPNGTVLPFGLLGSNDSAGMAAFNKTYKNTALRLGIVVKSYDVSNETNLSKLTTEYDVSVFEQEEDRGSTIITYKNCISAEGMGSIADFFERTLRVKQNSSSDNGIINTTGQNGAVVLILCLDGMSEKAIIVGSVTHPDRKSTLAGQTAHLEGEFNGVNIKVNQDGSAVFTFNGPTDNDGKPIGSAGPTSVTIASGGLTISVTGDANITTSGDANVTAGGSATIDAPAINLGKGAAEAVIKGDTFKKMVFDVHIHPTGIGPTGPPNQPMDPSSLSTVVKTK